MFSFSFFLFLLLLLLIEIHSVLSFDTKNSAICKEVLDLICSVVFLCHTSMQNLSCVCVCVCVCACARARFFRTH